MNTGLLKRPKMPSAEGIGRNYSFKPPLRLERSSILE